MTDLSRAAARRCRLAATSLVLAAPFAPQSQAAGTPAATLAATPAAAIADAPAGFDAVHASDAQIAAYALPPRPDKAQSPDAYAKWARAMAARGRRVAAPLQPTAIYHGPMRNAGRSRQSQTTYTSSNWSGAVSTNGLTNYNSNKSFYYLLSDFVVPSARNAACDGGWDYSSTWDGIDGWGSGDVLQAGTESDAYCSGGSTATYFSAWIEWYPYSESRISGFPVTAGDDMFVEVWNTSPTTGYAYLENISTGQTVEYQLTPPAGTSLVGNSAEFIVERPSVGGGLATLTDYALDYMSGASSYNFAGKAYLPTGSSTAFLVNMLDGSGNTISEPAILGKGALEYYYY